MVKLRFIAFLTLVILPFGCRNENESPVILQATHDEGSNACSFIFRKDKTYEWLNGSGLGVFSKSGIYNIKDSIIILDKENIDNVIKSKYLFVKTQKALWGQDTTVTYLFQVDSNGIGLKGAAIFLIYIDERNH